MYQGTNQGFINQDYFSTGENPDGSPATLTPIDDLYKRISSTKELPADIDRKSLKLDKGILYGKKKGFETEDAAALGYYLPKWLENPTSDLGAKLKYMRGVKFGQPNLKWYPSNYYKSSIQIQHDISKNIIYINDRRRISGKPAIDRVTTVNNDINAKLESILNHELKRGTLDVPRYAGKRDLPKYALYKKPYELERPMYWLNEIWEPVGRNIARFGNYMGFESLEALHNAGHAGLKKTIIEGVAQESYEVLEKENPAKIKEIEKMLGTDWARQTILSGVREAQNIATIGEVLLEKSAGFGFKLVGQEFKGGKEPFITEAGKIPYKGEYDPSKTKMPSGIYEAMTWGLPSGTFQDVSPLTDEGGLLGAFAEYSAWGGAYVGVRALSVLNTARKLKKLPEPKWIEKTGMTKKQFTSMANRRQIFIDDIKTQIADLDGAKDWSKTGKVGRFLVNFANKTKLANIEMVENPALFARLLTTELTINSSAAVSRWLYEEVWDQDASVGAQIGAEFFGMLTLPIAGRWLKSNALDVLTLWAHGKTLDPKKKNRLINYLSKTGVISIEKEKVRGDIWSQEQELRTKEKGKGKELGLFGRYKAYRGLGPKEKKMIESMNKSINKLDPKAKEALIEYADSMIKLIERTGIKSEDIMLTMQQMLPVQLMNTLENKARSATMLSRFSAKLSPEHFMAEDKIIQMHEKQYDVLSEHLDNLSKKYKSKEIDALTLRMKTTYKATQTSKLSKMQDEVRAIKDAMLDLGETKSTGIVSETSSNFSKTEIDYLKNLQTAGKEEQKQFFGAVLRSRIRQNKKISKYFVDKAGNNIKYFNKEKFSKNSNEMLNEVWKKKHDLGRVLYKSVPEYKAVEIDLFKYTDGKKQPIDAMLPSAVHKKLEGKDIDDYVRWIDQNGEQVTVLAWSRNRRKNAVNKFVAENPNNLPKEIENQINTIFNIDAEKGIFDDILKEDIIQTVGGKKKVTGSKYISFKQDQLPQVKKDMAERLNLHLADIDRIQNSFNFYDDWGRIQSKDASVANEWIGGYSVRLEDMVKMNSKLRNRWAILNKNPNTKSKAQDLDEIIDPINRMLSGDEGDFLVKGLKVTKEVKSQLKFASTYWKNNIALPEYYSPAKGVAGKEKRWRNVSDEKWHQLFVKKNPGMAVGVNEQREAFERHFFSTDRKGGAFTQEHKTFIEKATSKLDRDQAKKVTDLVAELNKLSTGTNGADELLNAGFIMDVLGDSTILTPDAIKEGLEGIGIYGDILSGNYFPALQDTANLLVKQSKDSVSKTTQALQDIRQFWDNKTKSTNMLMDKLTVSQKVSAKIDKIEGDWVGDALKHLNDPKGHDKFVELFLVKGGKTGQGNTKRMDEFLELLSVPKGKNTVAIETGFTTKFNKETGKLEYLPTEKGGKKKVIHVKKDVLDSLRTVLASETFGGAAIRMSDDALLKRLGSKKAVDAFKLQTQSQQDFALGLNYLIQYEDIAARLYPGKGGAKHLQKLKDIYSLGFSLFSDASATGKLALKNVPGEYTVSQLLGRGYNISKGVVSTRYVLSELAINIFRHRSYQLMLDMMLNRKSADYMHSLLMSDKSLSKTFKKGFRGWFLDFIFRVGYSREGVDEHIFHGEEAVTEFLKDEQEHGHNNNYFKVKNMGSIILTDLEEVPEWRKENEPEVSYEILPTTDDLSGGTARTPAGELKRMNINLKPYGYIKIKPPTDSNDTGRQMDNLGMGQ